MRKLKKIQYRGMKSGGDSDPEIITQVIFDANRFLEFYQHFDYRLTSLETAQDLLHGYKILKRFKNPSPAGIMRVLDHYASMKVPYVAELRSRVCELDRNIRRKGKEAEKILSETISA